MKIENSRLQRYLNSESSSPYANNLPLKINCVLKRKLKPLVEVINLLSEDCVSHFTSKTLLCWTFVLFMIFILI